MNNRTIATSLGVVLCVALCVATWLPMGASQAIGKTFYVDPARGSMDGDGSDANPWRTLEEVFANHLIETQRIASNPYTPGVPLVAKNAGAPVKSGDTIVLLDGYHGEIVETGAYNKDTITIVAGEGQSPTLGGIYLQSAAKWRFRGLTVSPKIAEKAGGKSIINIDSSNWHGPSEHISIEDSIIYSAANTSEWTANDWLSRASSGITVTGSNFVIRNNHIKNIDFGIIANGDDILAESNIIQHFSGDGMRGGGDRVTFQDNTIEWSYNVDDNHDDAIQFYRRDRQACRDVVLRGNVIRCHPDAQNPLVHGAQGIGNFDGPYVDWIVENNVVMVAHHHGITLVGAQGCRIINNTVLDITGQFVSWIQLKNSNECVVRNNLVPQVVLRDSSSISEDHNHTLLFEELDSLFIDWRRGDLRLKQNCAAIDAGSAQLAPAADADETDRPQGEAPDLGAYEFVPVSQDAQNAGGSQP